MSENPTNRVAGRSWLRRLLNRWEVDQAVFFAIAARGWQLLAGPVTLVLIALYFSPEVQGYYYTFWSLVALQTFFELSFHQVVLNFASHEWEQLSLDERGAIVGDPDAASRLTSLMRGAFLWYGVAALLFFAVVGAAGLAFFATGAAAGSLSWQEPWLVLVALTAVSFWTLPCLAVLEGCNQVRAVYKFHFVRALLGNVVVWSCIPLGAGLWTPAVSTLVRLACELYLVAVRYRRFFTAFAYRPTGATIDWRGEVWPFQWRLGMKGLVAYFSSYLIQPVVFFYHGEVAAGQLGMTWQVLTSLEAACVSWVKARAARFGMLVAKRDYQELDRIFFRLTSIAVAVMVMASSGFWLFDAALYHVESRFADRLLAPLATGILAVGMVCVLIPDCQWTYIHAHKRSPYLGLTIVGSLTTGGLIWLLGRHLGAVGACSAYTGVMVLFYLPVWTWVWYRCRREWHAPASTHGA